MATQKHKTDQKPVSKTNPIASAGPLTKPAKKTVFISLLVLLVGLIAAMTLVNERGLATTTYDAASSYSNMNTVLLLIFAALCGFVLSYRIARPRKPKQQTAGRYVLAAVGFVFGVIPGIIIAFIITYPLSKHACELSGSKYC